MPPCRGDGIGQSLGKAVTLAILLLSDWHAPQLMPAVMPTWIGFTPAEVASPPPPAPRIGVEAVTDPAALSALQAIYLNTWPKLVDTCCKKANPVNCGSCVWKRSSGWMTGDPCEGGGWAGVTCTSCPACRVIGVDLNDNNLKGNFPNGILKDLPDLEYLRLAFNGIAGTFPDELETTPKLADLRLGGSHTGPLPDFWSKHPETYKTLYFHGGFQMADHPLFDTLTNLELYHLQRTRVRGALPPFTSLTHTQSFSIIDNEELSGTIPVLSNGASGHFTQLTKLMIHSNQLISGTIPPFTDMTQAQHLQIDEQRSVSGTVPPLDTMTRLEYFDLSTNRLFGQVPSFSPLVQSTLQKIRVEDNFLQGMEALVPNPTNLNALTELVFYKNMMTGTFPCHQTTYPSLQLLNGAENRLTGTLPCLDNFGVLSEYTLNDNDFSGTLPSRTVAAGLKIFKVSNNILTGTISQQLANAFSSVEVMHIGANGFTGTLPDVSVMPVLSDLRTHRNVGWKELIPTAVTSLGGTTTDVELQTARDGNPTTEWECLTGNGDVCNILVDFGRPVCLENIRMQESGSRRNAYPTGFAETREPSEGCPMDIRVYQGSTAFAKSSITEPMLWRSYDSRTYTRSWGHGFNWGTCSPGSWRNLGREKRTDHESSCWDGNQGEGGGWDPYCRDRTRYYRLQVRRCSTLPCKFAEIRFFEGDRMSGSLPVLPPTLNNLWAYGNQLTGTIPLIGPAWENDLRVSDNWLEGPLPDFCPSFAKLDRLWIDHNRITGTLPEENCMSDALSMRVGHNLLTGTIPACPCGKLQEYLLDGNACCLESAVNAGHNSWRDEALESIKSIGAYTTCPRFDKAECGGGLEGRLPDFTTMPNLLRFGADNNLLRGPLDASLRSLTKIQWFRVRHNRVAGTLPYKAIIEAGNLSTSCTETSWHFTNNTLWGPVPDLPLPLNGCNQYSGCHSNRADGRKIWDFSIDYNNLWGPLPSRFERVRDDARVKHNCWDCPITEQAVWGPPLNPDAPGGPTFSWTSAGYMKKKELTNPPDCGEGPGYAERYDLDGPSCPAEPPWSLYEHVSRCSPIYNITAVYTEEEIRRGGLTFNISFADGSPLPFFAPGLWRCLLCEDAQGIMPGCAEAKCPYGPLDGGGSPSCPVDPATAMCPADVPNVVWPWGGLTCPVGPNASCPTDVCLPCPPGPTDAPATPAPATPPPTPAPDTPAPPTLSPNNETEAPDTPAPATPAPVIPICPLAGECPYSFACELGSACPFGPNGTTFNGTSSGCDIVEETVHAPNGTCRIGDDGVCPPGECNYPWGCAASGGGGTPWGPLPISFTPALKKLFYEGINTTSQQQWQEIPRGFDTFKEMLLPHAGFQLGPVPGGDPWVDLPTHLLVTLGKVPQYDTSTHESIGITLWDELLLAPFGERGKPAGYFHIIPSPGQMRGTDVNVSEDVVRGRDYRRHPVSERLVVRVTLPENSEEGGWETFRCGANYSDECPAFSTLIPGPEAPRTCNFECATEYPQAGLEPNITVSKCTDYEMEFHMHLPSYNLADSSTEVVQLLITGNCTASGLPPVDNVVNITVYSGVDPVPTMTVTLTPPVTPTHTGTATETVTVTPSVSPTITVSTIPLCVLMPDSTLCREGGVPVLTPYAIPLLAALLGCCIALAMLALLPKRKRQAITASIEKPEVDVTSPPPPLPPVEIGVRKIPSLPQDVTIGVTKLKQPRADDITVGVTKIPGASDKINVRATRLLFAERHGAELAGPGETDDITISGTRVPFGDGCVSEGGGGGGGGGVSGTGRQPSLLRNILTPGVGPAASATEGSRSTISEEDLLTRSEASQPLLGQHRSLLGEAVAVPPQSSQDVLL